MSNQLRFKPVRAKPTRPESSAHAKVPYIPHCAVLFEGLGIEVHWRETISFLSMLSNSGSCSPKSSAASLFRTIVRERQHGRARRQARR
jgi:hypothetical protein